MTQTRKLTTFKVQPPPVKETLPRYRTGRNWIAVGDLVKCSPTVGGSFLGTVQQIDADPLVVHVTVARRVNGTDHPQRGWNRAFTPDRIARISSTKAAKLLDA